MSSYCQYKVQYKQLVGKLSCVNTGGFILSYQQLLFLSVNNKSELFQTIKNIQYVWGQTIPT